MIEEGSAGFFLFSAILPLGMSVDCAAVWALLV